MAAAAGPLRLALVDGDPYAGASARIQAFTDETGIETRIECRLPLPELVDHLRESFDAGTSGPRYDLVSTHSQYLAGLAPGLRSLETLLPLPDIDAHAAGTQELSRWQGELYQLPRAVETRLLFYRSDIFDDRREQQWFSEASGGHELRVPRTWEELAAIAQYFTRAGKSSGFAFPGKETGLIATFAEVLTAVGGTFLATDGTPGFYSRAGEWALGLLRDLVTRWQAVPDDTPELSPDEVSARFRLGRCALICDVPNTARLLCDPTFSAVAGWHGVDRMPEGVPGRRAAWIGCPGFGITQACEHPEAAADLLRHLCGRESQLEEARHGALPTRTDAYEEARSRQREGTLAHRRFGLAEQTLQEDRLVPPALPHYRALERALWPLLQEAITGAREVEEALRLADAAARQLSENPPDRP